MGWHYGVTVTFSSNNERKVLPILDAYAVGRDLELDRRFSSRLAVYASPLLRRVREENTFVISSSAHNWDREKARDEEDKVDRYLKQAGCDSYSTGIRRIK